MQIVIAGKDPTSLEEYLTEHGHTVKCFYVNDLCLDIARAYNPDVLIYMDDVFDKVPHEQALKQLQDYRVLIIAKKDNTIIPYAAALGIKDYVFQPCELSAILNRVEKPATAEEAAELLRHVPVLSKELVVSQKEKKLDKPKKKLFSRNLSFLKERHEKQNKDLNIPEQLNDKEDNNKVECNNTQQILDQKNKNSKRLWFNFGKPNGVIINREFIKGNWSNPIAMIDDYPSCNAVVIPYSWGIKAVRDYRRDGRSKTIPLIVVKGTQEHLAVGADRCVKKITPELIQDVTSMSNRLKEMWASIESDPLTGVYTRRFLNSWMVEQEYRQQKYSAVILDLDKFKNVNDAYGHAAGDAVLVAFGNFLKTESREIDFVARYGGEEFFIGLPNTTATQGKILIDRLRDKWAQRMTTLPDGQAIKTTFSAGISEWSQGCNVIEEADKMLYDAKENGRNQVRATIKHKVLILGKVDINRTRVEITYDPSEATMVISDVASVEYAPDTMPLYVISTGSISDWVVKRNYPNAIMCLSADDALNRTEVPKPKLTVLPGTRSSESHQTIPAKGALYVVCPSRPAAAGEIAAKLCHDIRSAALVCASPESTAALHLGIPKEKLITSDWRIPGADAPIKWAEVMVWPVDPYKFINANADVHGLVDQIKHRFALTIIDCGGSLDICSRPTKDEGILILSKEGDASDQITQHWLDTYRGNNVFLLAPSETPEIITAENGFLLSRTTVSATQKT